MPFPYASALPRRALAPRGGFSYAPLWAEKGGRCPSSGGKTGKLRKQLWGRYCKTGESVV